MCTNYLGGIQFFLFIALVAVIKLLLKYLPLVVLFAHPFQLHLTYVAIPSTGFWKYAAYLDMGMGFR